MRTVKYACARCIADRHCFLADRSQRFATADIAIGENIAVAAADATFCRIGSTAPQYHPAL